MSFDEKDRLITVSEAAKILKLSVLTLYKYIKTSQIEALEFGGRYRIKESSLEKFILTHTLKTRKEDF